MCFIGFCGYSFRFFFWSFNDKINRQFTVVEVFKNNTTHLDFRSVPTNLFPRKLRQEKRVNLLEATEKHMKTNAFDPLVGKFNDPLAEERHKSIDDAREVEINMRGDAKYPPSYKGRETAAYGIVSHETYDKDMLRLYDTLEKERTGRFKNRYIIDHNFHAQDLKGDHIRETRQLNRVAPERYEEQKRRGYDIIDGKGYGPGAKEKHLHEAFPKKRLTPWEKATLRSESDHQFSQFSPHFSASTGEVKTLRPSVLEKSSSAPQLRQATPAASVRSITSSQRSHHSHHSRRSSVRSSQKGLFAPAPPVIPGSPGASAYSRPRAWIHELCKKSFAFCKFHFDTKSEILQWSIFILDFDVV